MGSSSSKDGASEASSSSGGARRMRSRGTRVFNSSCFGLPSTLPDDQNEEVNGRSKGNTSTSETATKSYRRDHEACKKLRTPSDSDTEHNGEGQEGTSETDSGASNSSTTQAAIGRSSNPSGSSRSRFRFIPDGAGFSLSRAASLGSSRSRSLFAASLSAPNSDDGDHVHRGLDSSLANIIGNQDNATMETISSRDVARNNTSVEATISGYSHRNHAETESVETRRSSRRLGPQEPLEGTVRFSRTLSVGRLRDRVLRRTSYSEGMLGPVTLEDRSVGYSGQGSGRRVLGGNRAMARTASSSDRGNLLLPDSSSIRTSRMVSSVDNNYDYDSETPQLREASNRDLLEHRSAFLERRRRIRSQVRALQRLGNRFEDLSGHDRSCILSGQHRTGRCMCRSTNRAVNPNDDTSTRASISRIVMLAEALFEVLDEIHQQSVVLSSRPSVSSIGSVPAPKEVVECMPVKVYTKPKKHRNEDDAQCYICLLEYEEGDCVRILPCHHEFHQICVDKWLKEIHRVCPLCRGDVCRSDISPLEKLS